MFDIIAVFFFQKYTSILNCVVSFFIFRLSEKNYILKIQALGSVENGH